MSTLVVRILAVVLTLLWASGVWAYCRRRRLLSENDCRRSEQWRMATEDAAPEDDPLLAALDIALRDAYCPAPECSAKGTSPAPLEGVESALETR